MISAESFRKALAIAGLALYPTIFLYSQFPAEVAPKLLVAPIAISLILAIVTWALTRIFFPDSDRRIVLTALGLVFFFSLGHVVNFFDTTSSLRFANLPDLSSTTRKVAAVYIALYVAAIFFLMKKPRHRLWLLIPKLLPILSLSLILQVAFAALRNSQNESKLEEGLTIPHEKFKRSEVRFLSYSPDIYYIVLDGYGRADYLKRYYNFDNQEFLQKLNDLNFEVLSKSLATYPWTHLSLTSTLNMMHLDPIVKRLGRKSRGRRIIYDFLQNNRVSRYLKAQGYRYIQLASTGTETMENPFADKIYSCQSTLFKHELYRTLVESSALRIVFNFMGKDLAQCHLENYANLESIAKNESGPKFVFAHFVSPHHPYLFDRNGQILRSARISNQFETDLYLWGEREAYISQLEFVNQKILAAIQAILSASAKAPIIILASDHGPQSPDPELPLTEKQTLRSANLTAVYTPQSTGLFPKDVRTANLFPILLNHYFSSKFPLNSHKTYSTGDSQFDFRVFLPHEAPLPDDEP